MEILIEGPAFDVGEALAERIDADLALLLELSFQPSIDDRAELLV